MQNKNTILLDQQIANQTYDQELDTYYIRDKYHNYNRRNNVNRQYQQQPKVR